MTNALHGTRFWSTRTVNVFRVVSALLSRILPAPHSVIAICNRIRQNA